MKYIKMLGLLAAVATALMAFAGTASATTVTSNAGTTPSIVGTATNVKLHGAFVTIECSHSEFKGKIESHGAGVDASGNNSSFTFTGCNYAKTVTSGGGFKWTSWRALFSLGFWFHTHTSVGTCTFTTNNTQLGTLTTSSETGGNAVIDLNSAKIPRTGGNFLCGSSGTLTGNYTITSPSTFNID